MLLFLIPTKNTNIQKYLLHIEEQTTKNDLEEFFFFFNFSDNWASKWLVILKYLTIFFCQVIPPVFIMHCIKGATDRSSSFLAQLSACGSGA